MEGPGGPLPSDGANSGSEHGIGIRIYGKLDLEKYIRVYISGIISSLVKKY